MNNYTMNKCALITRAFLLLMLLSLGVSAKTNNVANFGAVADDGKDDTTAIQAAVDDLKTNNGGELFFPSGVWSITSHAAGIDLLTYGNTFSLHIKGEKGTAIEIAVGEYQNVFLFGNQNQVIIENLLVLGDPLAQANEGDTVINAGYVQQLIIRNSEFYGLKMRSHLVYASSSTDLLIENVLFGGNAAGVASVYLNSARGGTLRNVQFIDYANYKQSNISKTHANSGAWVKMTATDTAVNGIGIRAIRIDDSRFDEGAVFAIDVDNVPFIDFNNLNINVSNVTGATGIKLNKLKYASIRNLSAGFTLLDHPAARVTNSKNVIFEGLRVNGGVKTIERDNTSSVTLNFADQVQVRTIK